MKSDGDPLHGSGGNSPSPRRQATIASATSSRTTGSMATPPGVDRCRSMPAHCARVRSSTSASSGRSDNRRRGGGASVNATRHGSSASSWETSTATGGERPTSLQPTTSTSDRSTTGRSAHPRTASNNAPDSEPGPLADAARAIPSATLDESAPKPTMAVLNRPANVRSAAVGANPSTGNGVARRAATVMPEDVTNPSRASTTAIDPTRSMTTELRRRPQQPGDRGRAAPELVRTRRQGDEHPVPVEPAHLVECDVDPGGVERRVRSQLRVARPHRRELGIRCSPAHGVDHVIGVLAGRRDHEAHMHRRDASDALARHSLMAHRRLP